MKRLLSLIAALTFTFLSMPLAQASNSVLLTEPTHRQINGQFVDDALATSLGVSGRLGQLVFSPPFGTRTWIIDPALIEEVIAMSNGYTLTSGVAGVGQLFAKSWLTQLNADIKFANVVPMAYGNPSSYWVNRLSPHEVNYVLSISRSRLQTLLALATIDPAQYRSHSGFSISSSDITAINDAAAIFSQTASFVDPAAIDTYRLALIKILNPDLTKDRRAYLIRDLTAAAYNQIHLVHLSAGKFTVTSTHQSLPITLTNGFPNDIKVNLSVIPSNFKVEVGSLPQFTIPAKSKILVMVPITVLTSGSSELTMEITNAHGDVLGDPITYPLALAVISPVATWFTTGAAIVLFIAASVQSIRRIRRRQK